MAKFGNYIATAVISGVVGLLGGVALVDYYKKPDAIYFQDLSHDTRKDLVIEDRAGVRTVFLQLDGGDYMRLDKYVDRSNETNEALEIKIEEEAKKIGK